MQPPPAQAVLDALPSEVVLLDSNGRIQAANDSWATFASGNGLPGVSWVGMDYLGVCRGPDGGDAAAAGIEDVLAGRRDHFELEYPCHGPDERRWFEMRVRRLEAPNAAWVVVSHENITGRYLAEEARRAQWESAQALAVEADRSAFMRSFLNEVSHEMRTPLATLALRVARTPEDQRSSLRRPLARAEETLTRVEGAVRALSAETTMGSVPLRNLAGALDSAKASAMRRDVKLVVELPDRGVRTDAVAAAEVLSLLASHLLATCPAGGRLELLADERPGAVHLHMVADVASGAALPDLWLLAARHLAARAGLSLRQEERDDTRQSWVLALQATARKESSARPERPQRLEQRAPRRAEEVGSEVAASAKGP